MAQSFAWIGLGVMGYPMAGHLAKKGGHPATVYNRTGERADKWVGAFGGKRAASPAEAARGADFVFSCVGADDDLRDVTIGPDGAFAAMKAGSVFIDHTTASADVAEELHAKAVERKIGFIDAPVSGGQAGAENGVLTVMCGGEADHYSKCEPLIAAYSRMRKLLGPSGSGQLAKMVNQIAIAGLVQGLAEAVNFGMKAGLDMEAVVEVISKGAAGSWQMENRHKTMIANSVRIRLRGRLDAQGPRHLPRPFAADGSAPAGYGARRPVLLGGSGHGRAALGYLQPDRPAARRGKPQPPLSVEAMVAPQAAMESRRMARMTLSEVVSGRD